jgi:putative transposase
MGRRLIGNIIYHVIKQGNNHQCVFYSNQDRETYLKLLRLYKERLRFQVLGYILLPEHVHLLLKPGPVELARIMHAQHSAYARYFNSTHQRSGHLFQGRYLSNQCTGPDHFWELLRWLHHHPGGKGEDYLWSSRQDYLECSEGAVTDWEDLFRALGVDKVTGRQLYEQMMTVPGESFQWWKQGWQEVAAAWEKGIGWEEREFKADGLNSLIAEVARVTGTTKAQILSKSRQKEVVWARGLIAYVALRLGAWTAAEVARSLAKHPATVIRGAERIERELDVDSKRLVQSIWRRFT